MYDIDDSRAFDILARELVEHCRNMQNFKAFQHPAFKKNPIDLPDLHDHLKDEKKGILQLDADFINCLKIIGQKGKKLSGEIEKKSKELFEYYENNNYPSTIRRQLWGLWVTENNPLNPALCLLAQVLWEDQCANLWNRKTTGNPAIAKPIIDKLIPILGPQKSKHFTEKEGQVICYNRQGEPLLMAPAVNVNMIEAFKKGIKEFSSLTGHKLIRWQVNTGFERWAQGAKDPRLIEIDGGFSKIAELTKCTSKTDIAKIKEILHAQAFGHFIFPDGSHGNMITLSISG